jgi:hypothetical protein
VPEAGVGIPSVSTSASSFHPGRAVTVDVRWSVPAPRSWRDLLSLELRARDGTNTLFHVRWEEEGNTLALAGRGRGGYGVARGPDRAGVLRAPGVKLLLAGSDVVTEGLAGPSVTLRLLLRLKPPRRVRTLTFDAIATNDAGEQQVAPEVATVAVLRRKR